MFNIIGFLFPAAFILIIIVFVTILGRSVMEWGRNNRQPVVPAHAVVVSRRQDLSRRPHSTGAHTHSHSVSTYYVTFQFDNGDRLELRLPPTEYGLLAEGDTGVLSFQGTRYIGFAREPK